VGSLCGGHSPSHHMADVKEMQFFVGVIFFICVWRFGLVNTLDNGLALTPPSMLQIILTLFFDTIIVHF
jgi:hypothetical protein